MDRRTFIAAGTWFSTAALGAPWSHVASGRHTVTRRTIALFDSSLAASGALDASAALASLTGHAARERLLAFDLGAAASSDIGSFWYTTLSPHVSAAPATLIGVTRAADFFLLGRLALRPRPVPVYTRN